MGGGDTLANRTVQLDYKTYAVVGVLAPDVALQEMEAVGEPSATQAQHWHVPQAGRRFNARRPAVISGDRLKSVTSLLPILNGWQTHPRKRPRADCYQFIRLGEWKRLQDNCVDDAEESRGV